MAPTRWDKRFFDTTRGQLLQLLRRRDLTVEELAEGLGLTGNAVRSHLALLERDGVVEQRGKRRGARKPAATYGLVAGVEQQLSRAYVAVLVELLRSLEEAQPPDQVRKLLATAGRRLAPHPLPAGDLASRVAATSALLADLGAVCDVESRDSTLWIQGYACPLGEAVRASPAACAAIEALVATMCGQPVREYCDRGERPRCRFAIRERDAPKRRRGKH